MKNISKKQLFGLGILYPSFYEQTAIAEALSDLDSLISSQEKLIKKENCQAGNYAGTAHWEKCLPGFSGEWSEASFADLFDFLSTNAFIRG